MIEDVKKYLIGITVGIKFGPSFSLVDDFGAMADKILYKKDSFFDAKMFPIVEVTPLEIKLEDQKSGDNLKVTSQDLILICNLVNPNIILDEKLSPKIKLDTLTELNKSFEKDIVNGIMKEYDFIRIRRIGYINRYIFDVTGLANRFAKKTIGDTIDGISDLNVRFSKKYPTPKGLTQKDVLDYHKVIFTIIKKTDRSELHISIDYQAYFEPVFDSIKDMNFPDYFASMERYNSTTFLQWLNKYYGERFD